MSLNEVVIWLRDSSLSLLDTHTHTRLCLVVLNCRDYLVTWNFAMCHHIARGTHKNEFEVTGK